MRRVLFRPRAIADIDGIWEYTGAGWGIAQANRYILALRATCEGISRDEVPGRDASAVRPGYRRVLSGRHVIFYRLTADGAVDIVRVLHERMDVDAQCGRQLPEDEFVPSELAIRALSGVMARLINLSTCLFLDR